MPVRRNRLGVEPACIADVAAAICGGVAVQELLVVAELRHTDAIAAPDDRGPVQDDDEPVVGTSGMTNERNHARLVVIAIDPLESGRIEIQLEQGRLRTVQTVEIHDEPLEPGMEWTLEEMPV